MPAGSVEIYALCDPDSGEVRYIGKARCSKKRLKAHLGEKRRKTPVYCWIKKLAEAGQMPGLTVLLTCAEDDWKAHERDQIARARQHGVRLLNLADGGDEPFCPREVRAANGRKNAANRNKRWWRARKGMADTVRWLIKHDRLPQELVERMLARPDLFGFVLVKLPSKYLSKAAV